MKFNIAHLKNWVPSNTRESSSEKTSINHVQFTASRDTNPILLNQKNIESLYGDQVLRDAARDMSPDNFRGSTRPSPNINSLYGDQVLRDPARYMATGVLLDSARPKNNDPEKTKMLNTKVLKDAGIDPKEYNSSFLKSEALFQAFKSNDYIIAGSSISDSKKTDIRILVDELNEKFIQGKPLKPDINLMKKEQLSPRMIKLADTLRNAGSKHSEKLDNVISHMQSESLDDKQANREVIEALSGIIDESKSKNAPSELRAMRNSLVALQDHMTANMLKATKEDIKQALIKQLKHLEQPGAANLTAAEFVIDIPTAAPAISVSIGVDNMHAFETQNYLTILESKKQVYK